MQLQPPPPPPPPYAPQKISDVTTMDESKRNFVNELSSKVSAMQPRLNDNALYKESIDWDLNNHVLQKRVGEIFRFRLGRDEEPRAEANREWEVCLHQHNRNLGGVVWTAAIQLCRYLEWKEGFGLKDSILLELGSGTGLVGLVAACYGGNVTLTDLSDVLPTLQDNLDRNIQTIADHSHKVGRCCVNKLEWGNAEDIEAMQATKWNLIIGSDLIHCDQVVDPLLKTLESLAQPDTTIIISYDLRGREGKKRFLEEAQRTFDITFIDQSTLPPAFQFSKLGIVILRRRL